MEFNETFGAALEVAIDQARERGLVTGALTPGDLLRLPQALTIRERQVEADEAAQDEWPRAPAAPSAKRWPISTRCASREGDHLRADLDQRADVRRGPGRARGRSRRRRARGDGDPAARARARAAGELQADETAVAQEIVRSAARSDISEEIARFRGHVATGSRWPTAPSRAGASSISCCRR